MAKGCTICQHPNCTEIDSLLDSGEFKKDVALRFGVSVHALSRHGRGLCRANDLDTEEEKWAARLEKTYQQASTDGDARAAQQVASTALRHVRQRKAEKAKATKAKADAETDDRISIGDLDSLVSLLTEIPPDPVDQAKLKEALQRARAINRPDMVQIFFHALENHEFSEDLATWAATWEPQKGEPPDESIPQVTSAPN